MVALCCVALRCAAQLLHRTKHTETRTAVVQFGNYALTERATEAGSVLVLRALSDDVEERRDVIRTVLGSIAQTPRPVLRQVRQLQTRSVRCCVLCGALSRPTHRGVMQS